MAKNCKTFVKVSNTDIYNRIVSLENTITQFQKDNQEAHTLIIEEDIKTKGKINLVKWMSGIALTLTMILFGYIVFK
jgi:hypothetical protein